MGVAIYVARSAGPANSPKWPGAASSVQCCANGESIEQYGKLHPCLAACQILNHHAVEKGRKRVEWCMCVYEDSLQNMIGWHCRQDSINKKEGKGSEQGPHN